MSKSFLRNRRRKEKISVDFGFMNANVCIDIYIVVCVNTGPRTYILHTNMYVYICVIVCVNMGMCMSVHAYECMYICVGVGVCLCLSKK